MDDSKKDELIMNLVRLFQHAFKDSDVKKELKNTDKIIFSGSDKAKHDTYERFGRELARRLNALDIKISKFRNIIEIYIFLTKKGKEDNYD